MLVSRRCTCTRTSAVGFTLIEVMVAIAILALIAVISWRGLDSLTRTQTQTQRYGDEVQRLQTGLAQWGADFDAMLSLNDVSPIDWDGRVLRLTRRSTVSDAQGLLVVAWTRREIDGTGQWLRWQSPPLRTRAELLDAWQRAARWAQTPSEDDQAREVAVGPLAHWQIYYFRNDSWSNPLSSVGTGAAANTPAADPNLIWGVRLLLTLPPGQAISGTLTRDWVRPTLGGGKS